MKRILLVDDSSMMRDLLRKGILSNADEPCEFIEASDGRTTMECLDQRPDVILLDNNMPDVDGTMTARQIRSHNERVPIIMISSVTDPERIASAIRAGITEYLEKPVLCHQLWKLIKQLS